MHKHNLSHILQYALGKALPPSIHCGIIGLFLIYAQKIKICLIYQNTLEIQIYDYPLT